MAHCGQPRVFYGSLKIKENKKRKGGKDNGKR